MLFLLSKGRRTKRFAKIGPQLLTLAINFDQEFYINRLITEICKVSALSKHYPPNIAQQIYNLIKSPIRIFSLHPNQQHLFFCVVTLLCEAPPTKISAPQTMKAKKMKTH